MSPSPLHSHQEQICGATDPSLFERLLVFAVTGKISLSMTSRCPRRCDAGNKANMNLTITRIKNSTGGGGEDKCKFLLKSFQIPLFSLKGLDKHCERSVYERPSAWRSLSYNFLKFMESSRLLFNSGMHVVVVKVLT
jgi:hypothetical protein